MLAQARDARSGDDFLPPDQAFRFSASPIDATHVRLHWTIAPGYYLYRDRIKVTSTNPKWITGETVFPPGQIKNDEYFGRQVIYHLDLAASVPIAAATDLAAGRQPTPPVSLNVTYQGCAEAGLCYPPITRPISMVLPTTDGSGPGVGPPPATGGGGGGGGGGYQSEQDHLAQLIRSGNPLTMLGVFFGLGLLLAFTPCVLPMVPILSGLIAGSGARPTTGRAFALSLTYVLGMSITYTVTGAAFAAAGRQVQAVFQQPWIIVLFAALFVVMALSMFGLFTLQMPAALQTRLAALSNRQRGGHFGGVAVMGALSALIVTTCVAPPLVATLAVIGESGAIGRGAAALFVMSLGMGAPLLAIGTSAGRWLPRAGAWMDGVKRLFGVLMLVLAAWMLTRIIGGPAALLLFAPPALAAAVLLWTLRSGRRALTRTGALLAAFYAVALLVGAARGASDPLRPWSTAGGELAFRDVHSMAELATQVQAASAAHQAVMLDFYADWCTSCKEMERYTFTDPAVRSELAPVRLLRADVTANTPDEQALLHAFHIFGPPTIAFYDASGRERPRYRVVGYMKAGEFAALLRQALAAG